MEHIELTVDGMTCDGCSARLKRVLEAADGVQAALIERPSRRVAVDYDAGRTGPAAIREAVADAGFTVAAG